MQLKKCGLIFGATAVLLLLLTGLKTGFFAKYTPEVTQSISRLLKNSSAAKTNVEKNTPAIENVLINRLITLETPRSEITVLHLLEDSTIEIKAPVAKGKPMEWIIWYLCSSAESAGYRTADCYYQELPFKCFIVLKSEKHGLPSVKMTLLQSRKYFSTTAKMAIVITDFSFETNVTTIDYLSFPAPLTISIISSKKMSVSTSQLVHEHHKELIIMLPMEPLTKLYRPFREEAILLEHTPEQIHAIFEKNTKAIPLFSGFSNLCGSRVLDDSRVMKMLLEEIKNRGSYLLIDRPTHGSPIAANLTQELGVPFCSVDISLDSSASASDFVADTLHHAALVAQKTGSVIISGRATSQFIAAIKKQLPGLEHNGIQLVPVSELLHRP